MPSILRSGILRIQEVTNAGKDITISRARSLSTSVAGVADCMFWLRASAATTAKESLRSLDAGTGQFACTVAAQEKMNASDAALFVQF
jgi:hypothetical protein